jgi:transposase
MEVLHPRCCGLDVHKETVVACLRLVIDGKAVKETRTFQTTTASLIELSDWLAENACTHIAMEATGVYWKPVWHILSDGDFELVLANAAHIKNVPGRKTDVKDADWISDLLAHGLIRPSFVPDTQTQEMRTFLRTRKQLVREKSSHILRIQKTLEDANIKLDSVITDIMGLSGRKMIEALIAGEKEPTKLARLADHRVKASQETLREALRGRVTKSHRFLLRLHLGQTDANLISWACICPRSDESAGKRRSTRIRKGSPWLKSTLVQCAWAAARTKGSYLQAQFHRIKARRGPKKAILAVAASILTAIYHMLKDGTLYQDLGPNHFDARSKERQKNRLVRRLAELGYTVELAPITH